MNYSQDAPNDQNPTPNPSTFVGAYWSSLSPSSTTPSPNQTQSQTPGAIDHALQAQGNNAPKVAIPRLNAPSTHRARRRSARACEPCRHRKIKCDGARPSCGQCVYHGNRCSYEDVKRVRDQKMLDLLSQRVERYEGLLRNLEGEVDESTARRIRKALKSQDAKSKTPQTDPQDDDPGSDSDSSVGSLEAVDLVDEDLNRSENTRAAGFYGKNSEVAWMQRLEDEAEYKARYRSSTSGSPVKPQDDAHPSTGLVHRHHKPDIPISLMNYHLDDLDIPLVQDVDAFGIPERDVADEYVNAYMTYVHPLFSAIRKRTFLSQYRDFFDRRFPPPRKWLSILNIIFAIGCRYCRLTHSPSQDSPQDDVLFFNRARLLGLHEGVLFEHTDLQQIQLEFLVAVYMLCLGQVNRASKFSSMALRSAVSLGINLRLTDDKTHNASKEARCRLWWSIYSLEHLLTSMHGRSSCVGDSLCSVPLPIPFEEESLNQAKPSRLLQDRTFRETQLRPTLFESINHLQNGPPWTANCTPTPSLFFYYLVDLSLILQAVLNKVYSIEGVREGTSQTEHRLQIYSLRLDRWLSSLTPSHQFTIPSAGPWHLNHAQLDDLSAPFARERVCLAMSYYSARITLCRPCLSQAHAHLQPPAQDASPHAQLRADMATQCLQAACSLLSILPQEPDVTWLARATPWWSVLHFLMQATTALLLGLSHCTPPTEPATNDNNSENPTRQPNFPSILETDLPTALTQTNSALRWIHAMASADKAARRAFVLCDGVMRKIAPGLGVDLGDWPCAEGLPGSDDDDGDGMGFGFGFGFGGRLEGLDELVDFEGGAAFT